MTRSLRSRKQNLTAVHRGWKSAEVDVFRRGWVTLSADFRQKGASPSKRCCQKLEWLPFRVVSKYPQCVVCFCHKARLSQTDR